MRKSLFCLIAAGTLPPVMFACGVQPNPNDPSQVQPQPTQPQPVYTQPQAQPTYPPPPPPQPQPAPTPAASQPGGFFGLPLGIPTAIPSGFGIPGFGPPPSST